MSELRFGGLWCVCLVTTFFVLVPLAEAQQVVPLWKNGPPGFEDLKDEAEEAESYWVKNIHNPSLTVFLPDEDKATGTGIVLCPGGGHRLLVFGAEGIQAAEYLNSIGVAAFVLKYRLGREEGSPYEIDVHAKQDGLRAMRLVRSRAKEWGLDPERIGIMGFSAGGEVVSMVAYASEEEAATSSDPLDTFPSQPNFQILIYPGPLGIPEQIPADAPPAFLLVANDDVGASRSVVRLIPKLRQAKVPVEAHIFARGGHAFNMGNRSQLATIKDWPKRLSDWLQDNEFLQVPARETEPSE